MTTLGHSSNVRAGKTPITHLDPGHGRKAGVAQSWRQLSHRRARRSERRLLNASMARRVN
jgi:hypothetical protein